MLNVKDKGLRTLLPFVLAATLVSCASGPPRTSAELDSDRKIARAVALKLVNDPVIYSEHIEVSVFRGKVTLSGFVYEPSELSEAMQIASQVPGVKEVEDQMELEVFGRGGRGSGG